jgi:hypothetical protein
VGGSVLKAEERVVFVVSFEIDTWRLGVDRRPAPPSAGELRVEGRAEIIAPAIADHVAPGMLIEATARFASLQRRGFDPFVAEGFVPVARRIFLHADEAPRRDLLRRARGDTIVANTLLSSIIPLIAARLGEDWIDDSLSFVDVTIAATRLQDAVRVLAPPIRGGDGRSLAVIVPPWEQHGLPAALLGAQLRRMRIDARVISGLGITAIATLLNRTPPDAVLVSVASHRSAKRLPDLTSALRTAWAACRPIVVGGPAVAAGLVTRAQCGADLVTADPGEALRFCGFDLSQQPRDLAGAEA